MMSLSRPLHVAAIPLLPLPLPGGFSHKRYPERGGHPPPPQRRRNEGCDKDNAEEIYECDGHLWISLLFTKEEGPTILESS